MTMSSLSLLSIVTDHWTKRHVGSELFNITKKTQVGNSTSTISQPPLSSDIIIVTDRPELKAKGERIIFEDREVLKRKFSLGETALFNPDRILVKLSRILTEN